jgi:hypothetical protein
MPMKRFFATTALTAAALLCAAGTGGLSAVAHAATTGSTTTAVSAASAANVLRPGGPIVKAASGSSDPTISENWSGYAATANKPFTYVHSTFVQPAITCPGVADQWTSNWVGLDGFNDQTVEQDGTFAHCGGAGNTTPKYQAWYELYPANSVTVFNVKAGDIMDASVTYANSEFSLTITDLTTGKTATDTAACSDCARSSAEWIVERPALCNAAGTKCFLTELADYGTTTMQGDEAQVTGGAVKGIAGFTNLPIYMIDPIAGGGFQSLDGVSALSGKSFTATWERSGNTVPITLGPNS